MGKGKFVSRDFTLSIENAEGVFVRVGEPVAQPKFELPTEIELTGTFEFSSWVDYWKLAAYLEPPR